MTSAPDASSSPSPHGPWVIDTTDATFQQDVFQRSRQVPVVVDFWATWCGPCRLLGPILEKLAAEYNGKFLLVKADTDQVPQAAAEFNVYSIPAVFAVRDGQVVHFFQGALPEPQLRSWLDSILPSPAEQLAQDAERLVADNPERAEAMLRESMEQDVNLARPRLALAQLLLDQQRWDDCAELIAQLERRGFLEPEAERIKAALELQRDGATSADLATLRAAADAAPDDLDRQLQLAEALAGTEQFEPALEIALAVVQRDTGARREKARELMVNVFRLLPDDSPLTSNFRRKLAAALY